MSTNLNFTIGAGLPLALAFAGVAIRSGHLTATLVSAAAFGAGMIVNRATEGMELKALPLLVGIGAGCFGTYELASRWTGGSRAAPMAAPMAAPINNNWQAPPQPLAAPGPAVAPQAVPDPAQQQVIVQQQPAAQQQAAAPPQAARVPAKGTLPPLPPLPPLSSP